jgi:hypothetical protein
MPLQPDPPEGAAATLPATAGIVPVPDPTTLTNQLVSRATQAIREVLETKIEDIDNRLNRLEPMLFERLVTTMETNNALYSQKLLAVHSEIDSLRLLKAHDLAAMRTQVDGVAAFYEEKFSSLDAHFELLDKQLIKAATDVKSAEDERFRSIAERFEVLDKQTIKAAADVKSAVDAAFAAAASGVNQQNQANFLASQKQEAAFTKQIDQLSDNVKQISKAIGDQINDLKKTNDDKFGDLKDRIVAMEGRSSVSDPNTAGALRDMANTISTLKQSRDEGSGGRQQKADSTAWIFGAIAAAVAIGMMTLEMFRAAH